MPVPGDRLTKRISLIDATGAPVLDATFTVTALNPSGTPVSALPPTHLGNGIYELSLLTTVADPTGTYYLRAISDTTPPEVREIEWLVKPFGTPDRWKPGDTMMEYITVIGPDGSPVLGETFDVRAVGPDGTPITAPAPTDMGNGTYRIAVATSRFDPPGSYYFALRSTSLPVQVFEVEFVTGQPLAIMGGTTLRQLRHMVMAKFGDVVSCTATQHSNGSVFIDEDNLVAEPGQFAGRDVVFYTGANAGQKRKIVGSSRNGSQVTFSRPLPFPVAVGDECDITNAYGIGITLQAVDNAIRHAMTVARRRAHIAVAYRIPAWAGAAIPIPVDAIGINDVYVVDRGGVQRHVRRGNSRTNGWLIDQPSRSIFINGYEGTQAHGMDIVVNARTLPNMLLDDDDVTMIDPEWLVLTATSHLCLDTMLSRQVTGEWSSKGMLYKQDAERIASRLTPNIGPNYQAVQHGG